MIYMDKRGTNECEEFQAQMNTKEYRSIYRSDCLEDEHMCDYGLASEHPVSTLLSLSTCRVEAMFVGFGTPWQKISNNNNGEKAYGAAYQKTRWMIKDSVKVNVSYTLLFE